MVHRCAQVENSTHMLIQQLSVEPTLHLIDQFWLEKTVHKYKQHAGAHQP
jgi:hypothetical protein